MILDTYETDGVPAPSLYDPVHTRVGYVLVPVLTLNAFCTLGGIALDRDEWRAFVKEHLIVNVTLPEHGPGGWWWWYNAFTSAADAQDERETQQDALR